MKRTGKDTQCGIQIPEILVMENKDKDYGHIIQLGNRYHLEYRDGRRSSPLKNARQQRLFEHNGFLNLWAAEEKAVEIKGKDGKWYIVSPENVRPVTVVKVITAKGKEIKLRKNEGKIVSGIMYTDAKGNRRFGKI